jgi:hypothetical protein
LVVDFNDREFSIFKFEDGYLVEAISLPLSGDILNYHLQKVFDLASIDIEKMKEKVRATAKTSGFKGGKLGYQVAGTNKRTGNKVPPQFYYSTDSTTTGR